VASSRRGPHDILSSMRGIEHIPWLYDLLMGLMDAAGFRHWRRRIVDSAQSRVLEIGCGTGRNLALYAPQIDIIGVDPDHGALQRARRRRPDALFVVASAEALPFRAEFFQSVVSTLVFCSVPDPDRGLRELRRVLVREGQLRMIEHVRHPNQRLAQWQDQLQPAWTWVTGGCHPNRDTETAVRRAGFVIETQDRVTGAIMRRFTARVGPEPDSPAVNHCRNSRFTLH
jgi:ubiquinone/menaquinone biosynthesis C-methylase UbiE